MFKKVLHPTDFSDVAMKAFAFVKQLKSAGAEEVVLLHVIDKRHLDAVKTYAGRDFMESKGDWKEKTKQQLSSLEDELKESGFKVKVRVEEEIPFSAILKAEEEEGASLIVIGSHGKSNIREMLLGSVSEKVVRKAKNPVLVVRR
ncbi:MAG: universal stress protein [Proteobacteria bacterium]|nr:universal stress protein [Pseudomonadota bacterium]